MISVLNEFKQCLTEFVPEFENCESRPRRFKYLTKMINFDVLFFECMDMHCR